MRYEQTFIAMDTIVRIIIVSHSTPQQVDRAIQRAVAWFYRVERTCSRFNRESELMRLSAAEVGEKIQVSSMLHQAIKIAVKAAEVTGGAFDPTVGRNMERLGFNKNYLTGDEVDSQAVDHTAVSYCDLVVDEDKPIVMLKKPMVIDLNAVVKGMAVDLAVTSLRDASYGCFLINAGGDIYAAGLDEHQERWKIGIRNPFVHKRAVGSVRLSDEAICTSGSYERLSPSYPGHHHLFDPSRQTSSHQLVSCTVIAPLAMPADIFSTAAFVLGRERGIRTMETMGFDCMMISSHGELLTTKQVREHRLWML